MTSIYYRQPIEIILWDHKNDAVIGIIIAVVATMSTTTRLNANVGRLADDDIQHWLPRFLQVLGYHRAQHLLGGNINIYRMSDGKRLV